MNNRDLAETFNTIADLLEIKGEVIYKTLAYRRAAESIAALGRDVNDMHRQGKLREIPGVGQAIAEKITELLETGRLRFLEDLKQEIPAGLVDLLKISGVGPKKAALFWKELGITDIPKLELAARENKLRALPGMGEKSEARILEEIEALSRRTEGRVSIGAALPMARELLEKIRALPGVKRADAAGSLRRWRATIGDIDLVAAASDPTPIMDAFVKFPEVTRVLGKGDTKSSVELTSGLKAQLWIHPPERYGTALLYATGSKDHNVRLRELALARGLSLSEHSLLKEDGGEILCATEAEVYKVLGMPFIPPELREDRGEVAAARKGRLPRLVDLPDIVAELHMHTTWSDGRASIRDMALEASARGFKYIAITDHSPSLAVTAGLTLDKLRAQRAEIDAAQKALGKRIRIFQGAEVEIRADGTLDYPDAVLAELDLVVASLHVSLRQPRERVTARMLNAIRNPHVDIIGHPTGRLIPGRDGADLDMDAVLAAAAESGVALEINANPARLDLDDVHARRALELGCLLSVNTDAHSRPNFDLLEYGVATARRAWATAESVINAWPLDRFETWLRSRGSERRPADEAAATSKAPPRTRAVTKKPAAKKAAPARRATPAKAKKKRA